VTTQLVGTDSREGPPFVGEELFNETVVDQLQMLISVAV